MTLPATDGNRPRPSPPANGNGAPAPSDAWLLLEAHDHQQIELEVAHELSRSGEGVSVELFFFIPRNVGINASNYSRVQFYGDLTTFLRVDLPDVTLDDLASDERGSSPLASLRRHVEEIGRGGSPTQAVAIAVKLFGHSFTEAVQDRFRELGQALDTLAERPLDERWAFLDEVDRSAESARRALGALRRAARRFEPLGLAAPTALEVFHFTDEHSSLYLDATLASLSQLAQSHAELFDGTGFVGRLRQTLARHARAEADYRVANGYLSIEGDGDEYFAYRQSFLKKAVQQALYVDTRQLATDTFVRNAVASVAAGLAAIWALVAQVPHKVESLPAFAQSLLFVLPVIAYIAKDRIKDLAKDWIAKRVAAFDHTSEIGAGSLAEAGLGNVAGRVKESLSFPDLKKVPREITRVRAASRTVRGADIAGERVLAYRRVLELRAVEGAPSGLALRQIIRLNLRHFLTRLDEPEHIECHYSASEGRFVRVGLPKVYHINVVARVASGQHQTIALRWRIVLNKAGIVRLENVS